MIPGHSNILSELLSLKKLPFQKSVRAHLMMNWLLIRIFGIRESGSVDLAGIRTYYCDRDFFLFVFREIFLNFCYYINLGKSNPKIIDCGSNIGLSVLFFKMFYPNSSIIAFEPQPDAFSCLEKTIQCNQITEIDIHQALLTTKPGPSSLFVDSTKPGSLIASTEAKRMSDKSIKVEGVRLSSFISDNVDLVKIDVEGGEYELIFDLVDSGKISKVSHLLIEYHHHIDVQKDHFSEFLIQLELAGFGYQIYSHEFTPYKSYRFQDIIVYAYNKKILPTP